MKAILNVLSFVLPEFGIFYKLLDISQGVMSLKSSSSSGFLSGSESSPASFDSDSGSDSEGSVDWADLLGLEWRNTGFALSETLQSSQSDSDDMPTLLTEDSSDSDSNNSDLSDFDMDSRNDGDDEEIEGCIPRLSCYIWQTYQGIFLHHYDAPQDKPIPKAPPQLPHVLTMLKTKRPDQFHEII